MSLQFLSNNLVEGSILTESTSNSQYPISNVVDSRRTKTYRSTSNSDNIVIDLGTADPVDSFMLVDNWQNGFGITSLTLEANGTDSWGAPAFSTAITLNDTFGVGVAQFAEQSYRFWRLVLTSTLGYCEVSNFFLGKASRLTTNGVNYSWQYVNKDLAKKSENRYGQQFVDEIGTRKELNNLSFNILDKDELDVLLDVYDENLTGKPFFIYFPLETDSLINDDDRFNGMYLFKNEPSVTNVNSGYYNTVLNLKENK